MTRLLTLLTWVTAALMVSGTAHAEAFPYDEESIGRAVEAEEARIHPRRRGPVQTDEQKEISPTDRQRASIERYMNEAKSLRAAPSRNYGRRGYRYDSESGYAPKPTATQAPTRSFQGVMPSPRKYTTAIDDDGSALRGTRFFQEEKPAPAAEPPRKQRWRVEEPAYTSQPRQPEPEVRAKNYPFDNSFAEAFQPKSNPSTGSNNSRQALLNVKKWMRGEQERADRLEIEGRDDDDSSPATDFTARIGLMGGYSKLGGQTAGSEPPPGNVLVGLYSDLHLGQFIGAEIEGFYGVAPAITEESVDNNGQTTATVSRSNQHMGAMADLKLRYALPLGSMSIVPKIGVGYGFLSVTAKVASGTSEESLRQSTSGFYWMAGLDFVPSDSFTLGIDYAATFNASGSISGSQNNAAVDRGIEGAGFSRLRLGAYVKIAPKISLGGQFVLRNLTSGSAVSAQANGNVAKQNEPLTQFMGILMYQL